MKTLKEFFTGEKKKEKTGTGGHDKDAGHVGDSITQFMCPMKCEGDKTYNVPGSCPACNMKLVAVDSGKDTLGHSHGCC